MIPKYQGGLEKTIISFCTYGVLDDTCGFDQSEGSKGQFQVDQFSMFRTNGIKEVNLSRVDLFTLNPSPVVILLTNL